MRCYIVALAGTLFGAVIVLAQQIGPNVVPKGAMNGAVRRALTFPVIPPVGSTPTVFRTPLPPVQRNLLLESAGVCAIPLLAAKTAETHDRIGGRPPEPGIDPAMVHAPRVPACPSVAGGDQPKR